MSRWDERFLSLAKFVAQWSKDPSTKCGAVVADDRHRIVSMGFNGLPTGVVDDDRIHDRSDKYPRIVHAEANALLFSSGSNGCTIYVWPFPPCSSCAGMIIQAGIKRVVSTPTSNTPDRWMERIEMSLGMFAETGVAFESLTLPE